MSTKHKTTSLAFLLVAAILALGLGCVDAPNDEASSPEEMTAIASPLNGAALVCGGFIECCLDETCTAVLCEVSNQGGTKCTARCPAGYDRLMPKDGGASCAWEREKTPEREQEDADILTPDE
jgi:hypothetical protein